MNFIICIFLLFPYSVLGRDALQFFIKHKKVKHTAIEIFQTDNCTKTWIEYKYVFENQASVPPKNTFLTIGVAAGDKFDCHVFTDNNNRTMVSGYVGDVIGILMETLNVSIVFTITRNITMLTTSHVDLIICHPYTTADLPSSITALYPIIKTNLVLIYKTSKLSFVKDIFILTFAGSLWLVFVIILTILAVSLRISTKKYSRIKPNCETWTWVEITLWAIAAACQQGLSHAPSGFASCLIFFLGYLMAYLLYTGFAAAITSILVQNVDNKADLRHIKLEKLHLISLHCSGPTTERLKSKFLKTDYVADLDALFHELDKENRIAVVPHLLAQQYLVKNVGFQVLKLDEQYRRGFLIMRNNTWKQTINKQLLLMEQSGILQNQLSRHLRPLTELNLNSTYSSAGKEHVGSAILLFLSGALTALLFLTAEFIFYFYNKGR